MATRKKTRNRSHRNHRHTAVRSAADAKRRAKDSIRAAKQATRSAKQQASAAARAGKRAITGAKHAKIEAKRKAATASRSGEQALAAARKRLKQIEQERRRRERDSGKSDIFDVLRPKPKKARSKRSASTTGKWSGKPKAQVVRKGKPKGFIRKPGQPKTREPKKHFIIRKRRPHARMRFFSDGELHRAFVTRRTAGEIGRYMSAVQQTKRSPTSRGAATS